MRGLITIMLAAFLITLFHACTLDKHIFQPSCRIFEGSIAEKWWVSSDESNTHREIYFHSYGELENRSVHKNITYTLEDCNRLCVQNLTDSYSEEWEIQELTSRRLKISFPDKSSLIYMTN